MFELEMYSASKRERVDPLGRETSMDPMAVVKIVELLRPLIAWEGMEHKL
jgi:hypothetical protein